MAKGGNLRYILEELKNDEFKLSDCQLCLAAMLRKQPKTGKSPRGTADGEMIHVDLTGRMDPSVDGYNYGLIMHANFTKIRSAIPIRLESEAIAAVIAFVARLKTQSGIKVKVIRSDLRTEFSLKL